MQILLRLVLDSDVNYTQTDEAGDVTGDTVAIRSTGPEHSNVPRCEVITRLEHMRQAADSHLSLDWCDRLHSVWCIKGEKRLQEKRRDKESHYTWWQEKERSGYKRRDKESDCTW